MSYHYLLSESNWAIFYLFNLCLLFIVSLSQLSHALLSFLLTLANPNLRFLLISHLIDILIPLIPLNALIIIWLLTDCFRNARSAAFFPGRLGIELGFSANFCRLIILMTRKKENLGWGGLRLHDSSLNFSAVQGRSVVFVLTDYGSCVVLL